MASETDTTPKKGSTAAKNTYGPGVKVDNWEFHVLSEPRDNYVYPISKYGQDDHLSTYVRLGQDDQGVRTTETRDMLAQVFQKSENIYPFKPLVNFTSYPCTDTPARNRLMKKANLSQLHPDYGSMDYLSVHQNDYRMPYPKVLQPLKMPTTPWLLNRVICSDMTQNYGTAPPAGDYQFLDEHTPIGHIRKLRHYRFQSFNPSTCLRDFPAAPPEYSLQKMIVPMKLNNFPKETISELSSFITPKKDLFFHISGMVSLGKLFSFMGSTTLSVIDK